MGRSGSMNQGIARRSVLCGALCGAAILAVGCGGQMRREDGGQAADSSGGNDAGTGGEPAAGGALATGGAPTSGGAALSGGAPASGGGSVGGGSGIAGGVGTGGIGGVAGAAGQPPVEFCTGETRVFVEGQTLSPSVTSAPSVLMRSCCFDYSLHLHTADPLGFDLVVDVGVMAGQIEAGEYVQGGSDGRVSARVRYDTDLEYAPSNVSGAVRLFDAFAFDAPWDLSVCLEVNDPESVLLGTRVYVSSVTVSPFSDWSDRFEIRLLADRLGRAQPGLRVGRFAA